MITFTRTADIAPGKAVSSIAFAHEIAGYLKSAYDLEVEVLLPLAGNPYRIAWTTRHKDLADFDTITQKLLGDQKYLEQTEKAAHNFIAGSAHDSIWRKI